MNIIVCLKQVPDTETKVKVKQGDVKIDEEGVNFVVNPYDEFAVEEAIRIKERLKEGTVTIVSLGPQRAVEAIRTALAMGADRAVHLNDPAFLDGDSYATAKALHSVIKNMQYDLILCGKQAIDDDCASVAVMLAEMLNLPQATMINKLEISPDKKKATVNREVEGGTEVLEVPLPAVFTCQKGLNEPRYPSLPGIMKAKQKELKQLDLAASGLTQAEVGKEGSKIKIEEMYLPAARQAGKIVEVEGEPADAVKQLVEFLTKEAKVI